MKKNEKMDSDAKSSDDFLGFTVVVVTFFSSKNPRRFPSFCFGNVSLSRRKSTTNFGRVSVFPEEECQFSLDVKQRHTFYLRKINEQKIAKVSPL